MESRPNSSDVSIFGRRVLDLVFGPVEFRRVGILRTRTSDVGTLGCAGIELGLTSRSSRCLDSVSASAFGLALASCGSHCSIRWLRFDCRSDSDHLVFDCRHCLQRLYPRRCGRVNAPRAKSGRGDRIAPVTPGLWLHTGRFQSDHSALIFTSAR